MPSPATAWALTADNSTKGDLRTGTPKWFCFALEVINVDRLLAPGVAAHALCGGAT